jgi:hypothetical protein
LQGKTFLKKGSFPAPPFPKTFVGISFVLTDKSNSPGFGESGFGVNRLFRGNIESLDV